MGDLQNKRVCIISDAEARDIFERRCQTRLGMSGTEFLRRLDAGELDIDGPDHLSLVSCWMIRDWGR